MTVYHLKQGITLVLPSIIKFYYYFFVSIFVVFTYFRFLFLFLFYFPFQTLYSYTHIQLHQLHTPRHCPATAFERNIHKNRKAAVTE